MIEGVKGLLFGIDFVCNCKLYFTEHYVAVANVDQNIPCTYLKSILYSYDLYVIFFIAYSFQFSVDSKDLILMGTELASQQIGYFKSHQIDLHQFECLLIVAVLRLYIVRN